MKKIALPVIALVIAVCCAFGADYLFYVLSDRTGSEMKGSAIFTDGHEAIWASGCEIVDGEVIITGGDPQFAVAATDEEVSAIRMFFSEPVAQNTDVQLFYASPGEGFGEENSIHEIISSGAMEKRITLPSAVYSLFRFDIERNIHIREIVSGNEIPIVYVYYPHAVRIILLTAEIFALLWAMRFLAMKRKERTVVVAEGTVRGKPILAIVACNLFLALTVVFFQPLIYAQAFLTGSFVNSWWICLLAAAGVTVILSYLMLLLPVRVCNIFAALSLGIGVAFLVQSLLLNSYRVFRMDTSFPIIMLNIFVWFGIVIISVVMVATYKGEKQMASMKVLCVIAVVLIAVQTVDLTILATRKHGDPLPKGYFAQEGNAYSGDYGFGDLMEISKAIGMPYYLKMPFVKK